MAKDRNLYSILGLEENATEKEIADAYSRLKESHGQSDSEIQAIEHAYSVLSDMEKRARYDITGKADGKPLHRRSVPTGRIDKARNILNTLFLAGAAVTTVFFILQWCGAGTTPFYWACGISITIKLAEYLLRLIP